LSMLEREMGRLEFREDVVDKAGLVVTHAPYDLIALVRARSKAPLNRVNGSTRSSPGTASFPVENVPDDCMNGCGGRQAISTPKWRPSPSTH
jgi:hypothetical protein